MRCLMFLGAVVLTSSFLVGCSGRTGGVTGTVTLDGEPVAKAGIAFRPQDGGRMSTGETNEQGEFTLTCYERGDGALPGTHVVTITKFAVTRLSLPEGADPLTAEFEASKAAQPKMKWIVPETYSNPETSGLTFTVTKGRNEANFELQSN